MKKKKKKIGDLQKLISIFYFFTSFWLSSFELTCFLILSSLASMLLYESSQERIKKKKEIFNFSRLFVTVYLCDPKV